MAKLYFNYGVMGSSKSANALMTRFNYEDLGKNPLMVKSTIDTRDGVGVVHSRIGLEAPCISFNQLKNLGSTVKNYDAVIVDEVQFLSKDDIMYLAYIVDNYDTSVICYGLKSDSRGELFEGSAALLVYADKLTEIKTICFCGAKAIMNARFNSNGEIIRDGNQVELGANDKYIGLCRKHYLEGNLGPKIMRGQKKG